MVIRWHALTEEELVWDMMDQMGNTSFLEQYPLFHAMMTKEKVDESVEEEEPRGPPPVLMEVATRCGFQKLRELLGECVSCHLYFNSVVHRLFFSKSWRLTEALSLENPAQAREA